MSGLDLYQTQGALLWMLAWSFVTGLCLGCFYDVLRAARILSRLRREQGSTQAHQVPRFAEDVLLVVAASVALILLCYYTNDGLLRGPAVWGMASGFFVYVQTVGRLTLRVEMFLSRLLRKLIFAAWRLLRRPVLWVCSHLLRWSRALWHALFGKAIRRHRERRKARKQGQQTGEQISTPATSIPRKGTTVFSTHQPFDPHTPAS